MQKKGFNLYSLNGATIKLLSANLTDECPTLWERTRVKPSGINIKMTSVRNFLRDLLTVYKTLIVLITPLILIVVPVTWNTTVSEINDDMYIPFDLNITIDILRTVLSTLKHLFFLCTLAWKFLCFILS